MAELQRKLNSQPHCMSTVKVRSMIGKEWNPGCWNGNVWEDSDETGDIEPPNSKESSLPVEVADPPHLRRFTLLCLRKQQWSPLK